MSAIIQTLARWSAGAALLFASAGPAVAQQAEPAHEPLTLSHVETEGPVASPDLDAALAALQGRPLDQALQDEATALVQDYYAWLEWREVQVSAQQGEQPPAS
ncbi:hypothetical protein D0B54_17255 [Solimonas sp. K1W22B-7]|uniref:hypothetical protein n=1 Tax=Solimonas sp. K1W22B-7 TaxID=2303331 RepID=UPI000E330973|nr:hypothetical protein [Solimonas sp. K1W22B-7]AXQ30311.1 hypothetical protein D0B54_17255 [Solimonas sp. K1W22B-7]